MLWFEPLILWLLNRLVNATDAGPAVAVYADQPGLSRCTAPVTCPATRRHVQWARFNRPPKRPAHHHR